jgi:chromate transporter
MTEPKADSSGGEFNSNMTADQLHKRPVNDTENGSHYQADEESQQNNNVVVEGATDLSEPTEWLADVGYYEILKQFSLMGWVAFGGPAAHIALFQKVSLGIA